LDFFIFKKTMKKIIAGLCFAALWGSGSVATKLGLQVAQPLVLISTRFLGAALLMLTISLLIQKERLPTRQEWLPLWVGGLLNMAIYPVAFVFAMKQVTAGIGTLGSAACPLIISVLNTLLVKQKITWNIWLGLFVGLGGVALATYPLLLNTHATPMGVLLLAFSMLCYSAGTVYYQSISWSLSRLTINGWQVLIGCLMLAPFSFWLFEPGANTIDTQFWFSALWLVVPISILAVQLWLYLLKVEPTKASLWLFLCPFFGFFYSSLLTGEPITGYTIAGTILVIVGLYLGKK
jgi:probable blue pigment (indigoidine) exporter